MPPVCVGIGASALSDMLYLPVNDNVSQQPTNRRFSSPIMTPDPGAVRRDSYGGSLALQTHAPPSLGWMLSLAAALFALALPMLGPLDDHHFAERSHTHGHIYLNGAPVPHNHSYAGLPLHSHRDPGSQLALLGGWQQGSDVLYLTATTAGLTMSALNAPYHPAPESLRPPPPATNGANPLEPCVPGTDRVPGANILPPLPPPII